MSNNTQYGFDTLAVHGGQSPIRRRDRAVPIYQTTSCMFQGAPTRLGSLPWIRQYLYRIMNPTTDVFEQRMAGRRRSVQPWPPVMAATYTILNIAGAGDDRLRLDFVRRHL